MPRLEAHAAPRTGRATRAMAAGREQAALEMAEKIACFQPFCRPPKKNFKKIYPEREFFVDFFYPVWYFSFHRTDKRPSGKFPGRSWKARKKRLPKLRFRARRTGRGEAQRLRAPAPPPQPAAQDIPGRSRERGFFAHVVWNSAAQAPGAGNMVKHHPPHQPSARHRRQP